MTMDQESLLVEGWLPPTAYEKRSKILFIQALKVHPKKKQNTSSGTK